MKRKLIDIDAHAFFRALERGSKYGLDYYETRKRIYEVVRLGKESNRKHRSKKCLTFYRYYKDNLSFYVLCEDFPKKFVVKTIIIEKGRK